MQVIVVGGGGFIGTSIVDEFRSRGHDVLVVCRSRSYLGRNYCDLEWDASGPWIGTPPRSDLIVHLAGPNGDEIFDRDVAISSERTRHVIDLCRKIPCCGLAYFSSFQVFGRWEGLVTDFDQPYPSNSYGRSHLLGESLVREFGLQYKRQVGVFRPTNIFGVNSSPATIRWHRVPADFCLQAVRDSEIVIRGDPNENRDFLPVESLAKRFVEYAERMVTWDAIPRVIGSGVGMSLFDMAKLVALEAERSFELDVAVINARKAEGRPRPLTIKGVDSHRPFLVSDDGVDIRVPIRILLNEAYRRVNELDGR